MLFRLNLSVARDAEDTELGQARGFRVWPPAQMTSWSFRGKKADEHALIVERSGGRNHSDRGLDVVGREDLQGGTEFGGSGFELDGFLKVIRPHQGSRVIRGHLVPTHKPNILDWKPLLWS
ncbi:hypothetical protein HJG60_009117 [Phyllostomus discolor]|uniref:Uncharacterized protein n=1 Tax=Phyllostomus discolor TaxID=89673 RepID=A0A833YM36_9CHIR|nr:hypothetical protein HJG60_009117 [Phyllostomus discolor]